MLLILENTLDKSHICRSGCYKNRVILDLYHFYIIYFKYYQFENIFCSQVVLVLEKAIVGRRRKTGRDLYQESFVFRKGLIHRNEAAFLFTLKKKIFSAPLWVFTPLRKNPTLVCSTFLLLEEEKTFTEMISILSTWDHIYHLRKQTRPDKYHTRCPHCF